MHKLKFAYFDLSCAISIVTPVLIINTLRLKCELPLYPMNTSCEQVHLFLYIHWNTCASTVYLLACV